MGDNQAAMQQAAITLVTNTKTLLGDIDILGVPMEGNAGKDNDVITEEEVRREGNGGNNETILTKTEGTRRIPG